MGDRIKKEDYQYEYEFLVKETIIEKQYRAKFLKNEIFLPFPKKYRFWTTSVSLMQIFSGLKVERQKFEDTNG